MQPKMEKPVARVPVGIFVLTKPVTQRRFTVERFGIRVGASAEKPSSSTEKVLKRAHSVLENDMGSACPLRHQFMLLENLGLPSASTLQATPADAIQTSSSTAQSFNDSFSFLYPHPQPRHDEIANEGVGSASQSHRRSMPYKSTSTNCGLLSKILDPALKLITAGAQKLFSFPGLNKDEHHSQQQATDDPLESSDNLGAETARNSSGASEGPSNESRTLYSSAEVVRDLEHLLKQKTFSRSEIHHLTTLLQRKKSDIVADAGEERMEKTSHDILVAASLRQELVTGTSHKIRRKPYELPGYKDWKRRHPILEYDIGTVGPIRRARVKSTTADAGVASPSFKGNTCDIPSQEVEVDQEGQRDLQTLGSCISFKSTENGERIQQEPETLASSEERQSDNKQEKREMELVDALHGEKDQECGEVAGYIEPVMDEVQTCLDKQTDGEISLESGNNVLSCDNENDEAEVSSELFPEIGTATTKPMPSKLSTPYGGGAKRKHGFKMSFDEDSLDWGDDCPLAEMNAREAAAETCVVQPDPVYSPSSSSTPEFSSTTTDNSKNLPENHTAETATTEDEAPAAATHPSASVSGAPTTSATTASSLASSSIEMSATQISILAQATTSTSSVPPEPVGSSSPPSLTLISDLVASEGLGSIITASESSCYQPLSKKLKIHHVRSMPEPIISTVPSVSPDTNAVSSNNVLSSSFATQRILPPTTTSSNIFSSSISSRGNSIPSSASSSSVFPVSLSSNSGYDTTTSYGCSWHPAFRGQSTSARTTSGLKMSSFSMTKPTPAIIASSCYTYSFGQPQTSTTVTHRATSSDNISDNMSIDDDMVVDSQASVDDDMVVDSQASVDDDMVVDSRALVDDANSSSSSLSSLVIAMEVELHPRTTAGFAFDQSHTSQPQGYVGKVWRPAGFSFGQPHTSHPQAYVGNIWRVRDPASGATRTLDCWWRPMGDRCSEPIRRWC